MPWVHCGRMDYGEWTENSRGTYNKGDGVARCSTQVFFVEFHLAKMLIYAKFHIYLYCNLASNSCWDHYHCNITCSIYLKIIDVLEFKLPSIRTRTLMPKLIWNLFEFCEEVMIYKCHQGHITCKNCLISCSFFFSGVETWKSCQK